MNRWLNSIPARYVAVSLIAAIVPLMLVGSAYDRYSTGLVETLTGERLDRRLTAIASRMSGFLDSRINQLDTLVHYPDISSLVRSPARPSDISNVRTVIEFEADQPDLYGILFLNKDATLVAAIPSQAAAGPPYWGGGGFSLEGKRRTRVPGGEIVGPFPPVDGRPGSLLLMREIPGRFPDAAPLGWIALHLRLASLTELMGSDDPGDLFRAVLVAPDGRAYSNVGVPEPKPQAANLVTGPPILPGWHPALVVDTARFAEPLHWVRNVLFMTTFVVAAILVALFISLSRRLTHRVRALVDGSQALASGQLSWRITAEGGDEISTLAKAFNSMAERLQQAIQSAVEVEKMAVLGQFATGVAHEVRNPLATMKTTVQALLATESVDQRRKILSGMDEEIDRLDDTLNDLLTYARPRQPHLSQIPIRDMLHRLQVVVEQQLADAGIRFVLLGEPDIVLSGDAGHVQQIMMNLVLNAAQAMPKGGVLTVRARREGGNALIEVTDTGVGMAPDVLARVTEPFFTTRRSGTGLGLSISRQLAELNGGSLEFSSEPGRGTMVTLRLPSFGGAAS